MNRLRDLLAAKGVRVSPSAPVEAPPGPPAPGDVDLSSCGKLVLRRERKGRGGKTATVLTGLPPARLADVARALRKALGCGSGVEDGAVVLHGDLVARAADWLAARGARRIVQGN